MDARSGKNGQRRNVSQILSVAFLLSVFENVEHLFHRQSSLQRRIFLESLLELRQRGPCLLHVCCKSWSQVRSLGRQTEKSYDVR